MWTQALWHGMQGSQAVSGLPGQNTCPSTVFLHSTVAFLGSTWGFLLNWPGDLRGGHLGTWKCQVWILGRQSWGCLRAVGGEVGRQWVCRITVEEEQGGNSLLPSRSTAIVKRRWRTPLNLYSDFDLGLRRADKKFSCLLLKHLWHLSSCFLEDTCIFE